MTIELSIKTLAELGACASGLGTAEKRLGIGWEDQPVTYEMCRVAGLTVSARAAALWYIDRRAVRPNPFVGRTYLFTTTGVVYQVLARIDSILRGLAWHTPPGLGRVSTTPKERRELRRQFSIILWKYALLQDGVPTREVLDWQPDAV